VSKFTISKGFTEIERPDVARLYWQAFSAKLGRIFGTDPRGFGVGTALLHVVKTEAQSRGLAHVRLDVIDTNPRTRALYLREGFVAGTPQHIGPLQWLLGFSTSTPITWTI